MAKDAEKRKDKLYNVLALLLMAALFGSLRATVPIKDHAQPLCGASDFAASSCDDTLLLCILPTSSPVHCAGIQNFLLSIQNVEVFLPLW